MTNSTEPTPRHGSTAHSDMVAEPGSSYDEFDEQAMLTARRRQRREQLAELERSKLKLQAETAQTFGTPTGLTKNQKVIDDSLPHYEDITKLLQDQFDEMRKQQDATNTALKTKLLALNLKLNAINEAEKYEADDFIPGSLDTQIVATRTTPSAKAIATEMKVLFPDSNSYYDGASDTSPQATGPLLHDFELTIMTVLRNFGLEDAVLGKDNDCNRLRLSAYLIRLGLSSRLRTAIGRQPRLASSGQQLWVYLQEVYGRNGIAGMLRCLKQCHSLSVKTTCTPDAVREHVDSCRSLWLMNEQQLCPFMTWGSKLAMLFAGLEAPWCHRFRATLVEELEAKAANEGLNLRAAARSARLATSLWSMPSPRYIDSLAQKRRPVHSSPAAQSSTSLM